MKIEDYYAKPSKTIGEHCLELMEQLQVLKDLGYIEEDEMLELVKYACLHHDDGKVNEEFQKRVNAWPKKLRFHEEKEIPHNILSGFLINPNDFSSTEDYCKVLHAILNHHDYGDVYEIMQGKSDIIQFLLRDFKTWKIGVRIRNILAGMTSDLDTIKIKGYLHKCDYSASGNYMAEYPNDFLEYSLNHVKEKWKKTDPTSDWNPLQRFCMEKRNEDIIVTAQTGMGKTEGGLQWIGNHKGFFVLPLRTAINAIYDRVRQDILMDSKLEERVGILHSESLEYYSENLLNEELDLYEYENRGKKLCLPLSISTMDQLFDFIFMYQGFELKLTVLSYSKIVIDEIQMYDPELLAYLIYGLKRISQIGGKIAVMTATLSPFVKELLLREIPFEEQNIKCFVNHMLRHNIEVRDRKINIEDILERYIDNEKNNRSNKILVVCNTIRKAQEIYNNLKTYTEENEMENVQVSILHSRFTREDRSKLEREILDFGQTSREDGQIDIQSGIWVSTSLVEASLDIDFDYLFTELQDLNSTFQRMGRCNRKGKKAVVRANCFIYVQIDQSMLTGSSSFIDQTIFELSRKALNTVHGTLTETQKMNLLNSTMTMENLKQSNYYMKYKEARWIEEITPYKFKKNDNQLRNILSETIIPSPVYEIHKTQIEKWEYSLKEDNLSYIDRMKLRANILKYSVSIPYWEWLAYRKAVVSQKAEIYPQLRLGRQESICVVECLYDEQGYRKMNYDNVIRVAEIL